jgi:hypothetical protein
MLQSWDTAMNEEQLRSVAYDFTERTATFVYEPGAKYEIEELVMYVDGMSDGRAIRINIFNGDEQSQSLYMKADGTWGGIADANEHAV